MAAKTAFARSALPPGTLCARTTASRSSEEHASNRHQPHSHLHSVELNKLCSGRARAAVGSHKQVCRRAQLAQLRRCQLNDTELQPRRSQSGWALKNVLNCQPNAVHCSLCQLCGLQQLDGERQDLDKEWPGIGVCFSERANTAGNAQAAHPGVSATH
jgi:hypothetical protein